MQGCRTGHPVPCSPPQAGPRAGVHRGPGGPARWPSSWDARPPPACHRGRRGSLVAGGASAGIRAPPTSAATCRPESERAATASCAALHRARSPLKRDSSVWRVSRPFKANPSPAARFRSAVRRRTACRGERPASCLSELARWAPPTERTGPLWVVGPRARTRPGVAGSSAIKRSGVAAPLALLRHSARMEGLRGNCAAATLMPPTRAAGSVSALPAASGRTTPSRTRERIRSAEVTLPKPVGQPGAK